MRLPQFLGVGSRRVLGLGLESGLTSANSRFDSRERHKLVTPTMGPSHSQTWPIALMLWFPVCKL